MTDPLSLLLLLIVLLHSVASFGFRLFRIIHEGAMDMQTENFLTLTLDDLFDSIKIYRILFWYALHINIFIIMLNGIELRIFIVKVVIF